MLVDGGAAADVFAVEALLGPGDLGAREVLFGRGRGEECAG